MKYTFNRERLITEIKARKGDRSLRSIADEIESRTGQAVSISTLSRLENGLMIDMGILLILSEWLGVHPGEWFVVPSEIQEMRAIVNGLFVRVGMLENPEMRDVMLGIKR